MLCRQTSSILQQLRRFVSDNKDIQQYVRYLVSIPGIGFITAVTVLGRIGDPRNLRNVRELSAFASSCPKLKSQPVMMSIVVLLLILSNCTLRSLLVEAA
jgi:transposase